MVLVSRIKKLPRNPGRARGCRVEDETEVQFSMIVCDSSLAVEPAGAAGCGAGATGAAGVAGS